MFRNLHGWVLLEQEFKKILENSKGYKDDDEFCHCLLCRHFTSCCLNTLYAHVMKEHKEHMNYR